MTKIDQLINYLIDNPTGMKIVKVVNTTISLLNIILAIFFALFISVPLYFSKHNLPLSLGVFTLILVFFYTTYRIIQR